MPRTPQQKVPAELQDVATVEQVYSLEESLKKAYSSERYEEFQDAVEKIIWRTLDMETAHDKLTTKIQHEIKDYLSKKGWQNKTFWVPTAIALVAAIAAILSLFIHHS